MSQEKLRPLLEAVEKNPEEVWSWMQLGDVAKLLKNWTISFLAYLAAFRLDPENEENMRKFHEAREKHLKHISVREGALKTETFKLPHHTAVILLVGTLNFDTDPLHMNVKNLITKGFKSIVMECSGLKYISGLGPSSLRNLSEYVEKSGATMFLVEQNQDIKDMLHLKGIELNEMPNLQSAFKRCSQF